VKDKRRTLLNLNSDDDNNSNNDEYNDEESNYSNENDEDFENDDEENIKKEEELSIEETAEFFSLLKNENNLYLKNNEVNNNNSDEYSDDSNVLITPSVSYGNYYSTKNLKNENNSVSSSSDSDSSGDSDNSEKILSLRKASKFNKKVNKNNNNNDQKVMFESKYFELRHLKSAIPNDKSNKPELSENDYINCIEVVDNQNTSFPTFENITDKIDNINVNSGDKFMGFSEVLAGKNKLVLNLQHLNYANRMADDTNLNNDKNELSVEDLKLRLDNQKALKTMSLLEFCSILEIVNFEDKSMKVKGSRGRLVNSSFNFHSSYDLYEIKEMKIKSKHYVPVIAG